MSLQVSVIKPSDLGPREIELWIQFQQRSHLTLNPFLSPTFARVVGRARDAARVAIIEVDGCIEGFLAFEAADGIARPIGWPANDLQGFIHSGITIEAREIVKLARLRGWRFHHAIADQPELMRHQYSGLTVDCPVIVATDFDTYLASRSSSLRREFGRRQRGLERDYGPITFEWMSRDPDAFEALVKWKAEKFSNARRLFADPTFMRFLTELATSSSPDCRGILSTLSAGPECIAVNLKLEGPHGVVDWFGAYGSEYARYSPGTMIILEGVRAAALRGINWTDLGYGQHSYKFELSTDTYSVAGGAVWAHRGEAIARDIYRRLQHLRSSVPASLSKR